MIAGACDAMAFYIKIEKYEETEFSAKYQFWSADGNCGEFEINKQSGKVRLLVQVSGDGYDAGRCPLWFAVMTASWSG